MIGGGEAWGILAYATSEEDQHGNPLDLPGIVLDLVDRGWVQVHRLEPWTGPDSQDGMTYGPPIPRSELPTVLGDPATWADPEDPRWTGAVTLSFTEAWRELNRQGRADRPLTATTANSGGLEHTSTERHSRRAADTLAWSTATRSLIRKRLPPVTSRRGTVRVMTWGACPACGRPLRDGGFLLTKRDGDDRRVCRMILRCEGSHWWWRWADRDRDPLEPVPDYLRNTLRR